MDQRERQKLIDAVQRKVDEGSVLVLSGSAPEDSNTDAILENLIDGMQDAGFRVQFLPLRDLSILKCDDCGMCSQGFDCHLKDDMELVRMQMMKADVLILALHCDGHKVNGLMKKFCERLKFFLRSERKYLLSGKKALIVTTLADGEQGHERKLIAEFYQECLGPLRIGILDMLFFENLSMRGAIHERPDHLSKAYYAGRGLAILIRKYHMAYDLPSVIGQQGSKVR